MPKVGRSNPRGDRKCNAVRHVHPPVTPNRPLLANQVRAGTPREVGKIDLRCSAWDSSFSGEEAVKGLSFNEFSFPQISGQMKRATEGRREKLAEHSAVMRNIRGRRDQSRDDNPRADLCFKLSNSGCALCHAVLSHTERKGSDMNQRQPPAPRLPLLFSRRRNNLEQK